MFTFANNFEAAAKAITGDVAELKDCGGMVLVRDGTPASDERQKQSGLLMIPFEAGDERYWICSR